MKTKQPKRKYWYVLEIEACVLCGREDKTRYRVYEKPEHPIIYNENACDIHFCC